MRSVLITIYTAMTIGKKTVNASGMFSELFVTVEPDVVQLEDEADFDESAVDKLDALEASVHDIT